MTANTKDFKRNGQKKGLKKGFTMIEVIGVLFIGAMIVIGGIAMIGRGLELSRISDAKQALTAMSIQIRGQFAGVRDYTGLSNALAINAGLVPSQILRGTNILTPWGGAITLAPGANATFTSTWAGLSNQVCISLATFQPETWRGISVNGTAIVAATAVAQANTLCTGNSNTVVFSSM